VLKFKQRIIEISKKHKLSHLGSCFSVLPILVDLYEKYKDEVIILSSGHAGLAQYVLLEHHFGFDAEHLLEKHGIHPGYDKDHKIYCSTGALGSGLTVGVGYALAGMPTHCVISDGECAEGSIWEALTFIHDYKVDVDVHVNMNGFSAYKPVDMFYLTHRLKAFLPSINIWMTKNYPFDEGLSAHYCQVMEEHEKKLC
jgi:transketolase